MRHNGGFQRPPRDVKAVHTIIPKIACPVIKKPTPVTVKTETVKRTHWSWPEPVVVVHAGRRFTVWNWTYWTLTRAFPGLGKTHFPEFSTGNVINRPAVMQPATSLGAHLRDTLVFASRHHHRATLHDIVAIRLFHVDILASLTSMYRGQRMPMIRAT